MIKYETFVMNILKFITKTALFTTFLIDNLMIFISFRFRSTHQSSQQRKNEKFCADDPNNYLGPSMKDIANKQKQQEKSKEDDEDTDIKERLRKLKQKQGIIV